MSPLTMSSYKLRHLLSSGNNGQMSKKVQTEAIYKRFVYFCNPVSKVLKASQVSQVDLMPRFIAPSILGKASAHPGLGA